MDLSKQSKITEQFYEDLVETTNSGMALIKACRLTKR
jgi:hypothetical protein